MTRLALLLIYIATQATFGGTEAWLSEKGWLRRVDKKGNTLGTYRMVDQEGHELVVPSMIETADGRTIGCASWNVGLFAYDAQADSIVYLPWGIDGSPQCVVEDTCNACFWVATWGAGIVKHTGEKATRSPLFADTLPERRRVHTALRLTPDGVLWARSLDGQETYRTDGGKLTPLGAPYRRWTLPGDGAVPEQLALENGRLWVYAQHIGTMCLTPNGVLYPPMGAPLGLRMTPVAEGEGVWARNSKSLYHLACECDSITAEKVSFLGQDIFAMLDDGKGLLWIGGDVGLQVYDRKTNHPRWANDTLGAVVGFRTEGDKVIPIREGAEPQQIVDCLGHVWELSDTCAVERDTLSGWLRRLRCSDEALLMERLTCITPVANGVLIGGPGAVVFVRSGLGLGPEEAAEEKQESNCWTWIALAMAVLTVTLAEAKPRKGVAVARQSDMLLQAQAAVDAHIGDAAYDVDQLASDLHMSRSSLYRAMETHCGQKPAEFIRERRMTRAAELLSTTDLSISEVAYSVGFAYASHFSKVFKERFGLAPKDYRSANAGA